MCQGAHPWWGPNQGQRQLGSGWKGKQIKENSPKPPPGQGPYGGGPTMGDPGARAPEGPTEKAAGRETSGKGVEGWASGRGRGPFSLSGGWEEGRGDSLADRRGVGKGSRERLPGRLEEDPGHGHGEILGGVAEQKGIKFLGSCPPPPPQGPHFPRSARWG